MKDKKEITTKCKVISIEKHKQIIENLVHDNIYFGIEYEKLFIKLQNKLNYSLVALKSIRLSLSEINNNLAWKQTLDAIDFLENKELRNEKRTNKRTGKSISPSTKGPKRS